MKHDKPIDQIIVKDFQESKKSSIISVYTEHITGIERLESGEVAVHYIKGNYSVYPCHRILKIRRAEIKEEKEDKEVEDE